MQFRLEIQGIETVCNFRLSWGKGGEQISATVPYPTTVILAYEHWREQYLAFYHNLPDAKMPTANQQPINQTLRGRADSSGSLEPITIDWRLSLKHAQETLRSEFQEWLGRGGLLPIRRKLAQAIATGQGNKSLAIAQSANAESITVLLSCFSLDLDRLPWEDWEILSEFGSSQQIRFVRSPLNIPYPTAAKIHRPRLRMLAIWGDATGQDFTDEKEALKSLEPQIKVEFLNLQEHQKKDLKQLIYSTLENPIGWDILFFAGHSDESTVAGGVIQIALNQGMLMSELFPSLQIAKEQGLHFAIFNSCSGLDIAQSLIQVGLSQVVIMREAILGQVASKFFVNLAQNLRQGQDSQTAFLSACGYLKQINQAYPSAFLVPSLFAHPDATSISLTGWRWRSWFKQILPKRREAIVLSSCIALSLFPAVREPLLNQRMLVQAQYRNLTKQFSQSDVPSVLLVQIDKDTIGKINEGKVPGLSPLKVGNSDKNIMDRGVIAKIIDQLTSSGAKVIGIDYLFDETSAARGADSKADQVLANSVKSGFQQYGTWFIFGHVDLSTEGYQGVNPETGIANPSFTLHGCVNTDSHWYLKLPSPGECQSGRSIKTLPYTLVPFPYMLSLASLFHKYPHRPEVDQKEWFQNIVVNSAYQESEQKSIITLGKVQESDLTFASRYIKQYWLQPNVDYSIPPDYVFKAVSAIEVINGNLKEIKPEQIVVISAGGHEGAGFDEGKRDIVGDLPFATEYWRILGLGRSPIKQLTGGEFIAYATYHFQSQRFLISIPDLWMLLSIGVIGRCIHLLYSLRNNKMMWLAFPIGYIGLSLQLYITAGVLMPIVFPTIVWVWYSLPFIWRQKNA